MCLATSGSTVCKDCGIVTVKHAVKQISGCCFINIALSGVFVKDTVEHESLVLDPFSLWYYRSGESLHGVVFWGIKNSVAEISVCSVV